MVVTASTTTAAAARITATAGAAEAAQRQATAIAFKEATAFADLAPDEDRASQQNENNKQQDDCEFPSDDVLQQSGLGGRSGLRGFECDVLIEHVVQRRINLRVDGVLIVCGGPHDDDDDAMSGSGRFASSRDEGSEVGPKGRVDG